jgi:cytochrome P450
MPDNAIRLADLDQSNVVDLDLGSEALRQRVISLMPGWATRKPFYCVRRGLPVVVVGRHKEAKEVFMDGERFSVVAPKAEGYEIFDLFGGIESVLQMEGERHHRVRRLMNPAFTPAAMNALRDSVQQIVDDKLDAIGRTGGAFDAMTDFCGDMITRVMLDATLQLNPAQQRAFTRVHDSFALIAGLAPGEPYPAEYVEAGRALHGVMMQIIQERRQKPRNDFISNLVTARDRDDRLSDEELFGQINAVCAAAQGTTASSLGAALLNLGRRGDQFDALKRDPSLIDGAIEECLRFQSSGFFTFPRFATLDTQIGGVKVPRGMPVYASGQAANFDPEVFPDPLRFDIRRNPRAILTFGTGAHTCIGNRLARLVMRASLLSMMQRFPGLRLADPHFEPVYRGMFGELYPQSIPMRTH